MNPRRPDDSAPTLRLLCGGLDGQPRPALKPSAQTIVDALRGTSPAIGPAERPNLRLIRGGLYEPPNTVLPSANDGLDADLERALQPLIEAAKMLKRVWGQPAPSEQPEQRANDNPPPKRKRAKRRPGPKPDGAV